MEEQETTTAEAGLEALSQLACLQFFERHEGETVNVELWRKFKAEFFQESQGG